MRSAVRWFAGQFSSYNHPVRVGVIDGVLSMAAIVLGELAVTAMLNAVAPEGESYGVLYGEMFIFAGVIGLLVALMSGFMTRVVQNRPYLVRSYPRTILSTLIMVAAPVTVLWAVFSVYYGSFDVLGWVGLAFVFGPIGAFFGYRVLGFYDPHGIGKLLGEGRIDEADAVMARAAAAQGLTWVPK